MRRIKVLHFIQSSSRSAYLNAIARHCDRERFELTMASLGPSGPLQTDMAERGLPAFALGCTRRSHYPAAVLRLARMLDREGFDVVQTHLFDASVVGLTAARLARTRLAILNDHHSAEVLLHRRPSIVWIDRFATNCLAHRVLVPSPYMKEILVREEGVSAERIAVIPYGLDLSVLRPANGGGDRVRRELGLENRIVFGAVGRLHWVKNYPALLESFAEVARRRADVALVIAGDGPDAAPLRKLASELGIEDAVKFLGFRPDVLDVLRAIDVLVHASLVECSVQVVAEALAVGTPVVSTEVGGATELVERGVSGYLVPPGDGEALARTLFTMLERRSEWRAMGAEGRARVEKNSAERIQPLYEAQYVKWLSERNGEGVAARGPLERQQLDRNTPWWGVHQARYRVAQRFVGSRRVLDIACGTGYGLGILADAGAEVVGVDVAMPALREARRHVSKPVLMADGARLPFACGTFDAVVSLETIEHLEDRVGFVRELARVLRDDGLLLLSTPNALHTRPVNGKPRNPFHLFEYTPGELRAELGPHFAVTELLGQRLDPRFVVPPFWDEQEELARNGRRLSVLLWRALNKLPRTLGNAGSSALFGHSLIPSSDDYRFEEVSDATGAPVLLAICRSPVRRGESR